MPPITSDTISLRTPYADGTNGQHKDYELADYDVQHNPVSNPPYAVFSNSQPTLVSAVFNPDNLGPSIVRVKTIAPKPANINTVTIKLRDGRLKPDNTPYEIVITVNLTASPSGESFEIKLSGPIVDD